MGGKSRQEKLAQYVLDGSVSKVQRFIKEHKRIDINSVRLVIHKYQPLLHMACERGHRGMVVLLLQMGADPALLDHTKGDTALHVASRRVLSGHKADFKTIALTILKYSPPDILDIENKSGQTARHLLKKFVTDQGMTIGQKVRTEEDEWEEKLSRAWEDDMTDNLPENSYYEGFGDEKPQESFDDWADRLTSEYRAKRKGGRLPEQETESREQKKRKTEDENSRNAKHKKKQKRGPDRRNHTLLMRLRYEKRMAAFEAEDGEDVGFDDIPWPGSTDNTDHMVTILVSDKSKMSAEDLKKYLRTHQRTWHPDKFMQKFGKRLKESDRERILDKVKELSQALNKAGEEGEKKDEWDY
uniref:NF-kappa-B inhibitor-like protein 1 n=1 Tax=Stichopus japonicus TaxID=307972 RepID=V5N7B8_STIJA|nr:NF-kappa-B inhibitor [Apostichopus japonicus]